MAYAPRFWVIAELEEAGHLEECQDGIARRQSNADHVGHLRGNVNQTFCELLRLVKVYRYRRLDYHPARILLGEPVQVGHREYRRVYLILRY